MLEQYCHNPRYYLKHLWLEWASRTCRCLRGRSPVNPHHPAGVVQCSLDCLEYYPQQFDDVYKAIRMDSAGVPEMKRYTG